MPKISVIIESHVSEILSIIRRENDNEFIRELGNVLRDEKSGFGALGEDIVSSYTCF